MQTISIATKWKKGLQSEARAREFSFLMDEPENIGGSNTGMTPLEVLLSSLGGCLTITTAAYAPQFKVEFSDIDIKIEGDFDPRGFKGYKDIAPGFQEIRFTINIDTDAPQETLNKLLEIVKNNCPVSDTLKGIEVNGTINRMALV